MKDLYCILVFVLFSLYSCKKHNEVVTFPTDKLYILEYNYAEPKANEEPWTFYVLGFCVLDKDFNIRYAGPFLEKEESVNYYYYNSKHIEPDSLRNKISNTLLKYQTDTTFLYKGKPGSRIYDGNRYRFIMQKNNQKDIIIKFEPNYLPEDLKFIFTYLYENRDKSERCEQESVDNGLFNWFENQTQNDRPTIKITFPAVAK